MQMKWPYLGRFQLTCLCFPKQKRKLAEAILCPGLCGTKVKLHRIFGENSIQDAIQSIGIGEGGSSAGLSSTLLKQQAGPVIIFSCFA